MARPGGDRIKELSNTNGTGSFVLAGAVAGEGVRAFSAAENGLEIRYGAKHVTADEGESGYGIYTHSTRTLTRVYRYSPTLGGSAVSFSAGGVHVSCTAISGDFLPNIDTVDPGVNDDISSGFLRGHEWINTATPSVWKCVNHTQGAAVWVRLDGGGGGGGGLEVVDDATTAVTLDANDDGFLRNLTSDSTIAATLGATTPVGTHFGISKGGSGLITVSCAAGAGYYTSGSDQGNAPATASFTCSAWATFRCISNVGGSSARYLLEGAGLSLRSIATNVEIRGHNETVQSLGNISGAVSINYANGAIALATLTGDVTSLSFSNMEVGATIMLIFALGSHSLATPATTQWPGGTPPDIGTGKVVISYLKETTAPLYQGFLGGANRA